MDEAPRRLIDDPEASSSLRDDLARAGEEHHAYAAAYDAASKAAGLQAAMAHQGGGAAGMGWLAKIALGVSAAAVFMGAGAALHASLQARKQAASHGAAPAPVAPAPVVPAPTPHRVEPPEVVAPEARARTAAAPTPSPAAPPRVVQHAGMQHEIRQLARIRERLQSGDAASALALAERGQRELGESALWQEREALAVIALFELNRAHEAQRRGAVLLARFPHSPFRAELEQRARGADEP